MNIDKLKQLYNNAYAVIPDKNNIVPFVFQFGSMYFAENSSKILFVGKSVNGWRKTNQTPDDWFDLKFEKRLFMQNDQITWVLDLEGANNGYNSKRSAFWRLIRSANNGQENQFHEIAWTNLYKFSPEKGNPNSTLRLLQQNYAIDILMEEITLLKPKYIVFLTSGWEAPFLNGEFEITPIHTIMWGKHITKIGIWNGIKIITSVHPQGKPESIHAEILKSELRK